MGAVVFRSKKGLSELSELSELSKLSELSESDYVMFSESLPKSCHPGGYTSGIDTAFVDDIHPPKDISTSFAQGL
jgi:hypothetical protein